MTIKVTYNVTDVYVTQDVSPVYINVSYSTGSSGGSAVWGGITGTLSDQTDLQSALDLKVPYTGATTNVNLGEYEIKAGQVTLDTSPTGTAAVGTTRWNDTTGLSETTLKGGTVVLKNGVDLVARVVNKVTPNTTLTKAAYQAVRVSGAQGQRLAVAFAQANNDNNSADTIGLVIETIATNQEGFIMTVGQIEGINTTGSLQGETWADGDIIYLSPTTAGAVTNVKPSGGQHLVIIGYVEYAHANNGKLYIKISNGWELTELHDTDIVTPLNNEALIYESSSALWKNKSIATALGYTPANSATTLTINGVSYDLSANRSWTVSGGISGSGASGQVAYWTGTSAQAGSNNLFWDAANARLGIGTNAPPNELSIVGNKNGVVAFSVSNTNTGAAAATAFNFGQSPNSNPYNAMFVVNYGSGWVGTGSAVANSIAFTAGFGVTAGMSFVTDATNAPIRFFTRSTSLEERVRIFGATGNLLLQNGGTFTDSGERLQVTGTMKVTGNVAVDTNTLFVDTTNKRIGIGTASPAFVVDIAGNVDGLLRQHIKNSSTGALAQTAILLRNDANTQYMFGVTSTGFTTVVGLIANDAYVQHNDTLNTYPNSGLVLKTSNANPVKFQTNNVERGRFFAGGNFALGTTTDVASAIFHITSTTQGFLPPRMTTTQKNAISSPAAGLVVYDTTDNKHYGYDGTTWNAFY